jgi:energy-coupling factor transporter ATP-binding protein EcfA2
VKVERDPSCLKIQVEMNKGTCELVMNESGKGRSPAVVMLLGVHIYPIYRQILHI